MKEKEEEKIGTFEKIKSDLVYMKDNKVLFYLIGASTAKYT